MSDYTSSHTIKYRDEITNATSLEELFILTQSRLEFETFSARIESYSDKNFVNIEMRIHADTPDLSEISISSDDKDRLIVMKQKLKELFKKYETPYSFLYKIPMTYRLIIGAILVLASDLYILTWLYKLHIISLDVVELSAFIVGGLLIVFYNKALSLLMPFIKFRKLNIAGAGFVITGFVTIFWNFIYDLIRKLLRL